MISDIVESLSPFGIFCHLFYCKRGFTVVGKCQYCTHFFVDSHRTSHDIGRNLTFNKSEMNKDMMINASSDIFRLNMNYVSAVCSINGTLDLTDTVNFGVIHFDSISSPMSLYIFHFEIYVRVYVNRMKKRVLKEIIENLIDNRRKQKFGKNYG